MIRRLLSLFGRRRVHTEPAQRIDIYDAMDISLTQGYNKVDWSKVQW